MEKKDISLSNVFQQWKSKAANEEIDLSFSLKKEVFGTIDTLSLVADIIDLFTIKLMQSQSEMVDTIQDNAIDFGAEERLFQYYDQKFKE